jgi:hypothetical protein
MTGAALRSDVRRFFLHELFNIRGSRISRLASPIALNPSTANTIREAGNVAMIGCLRTDRADSGSDKLRRSTIAEAIEKLWLASPPHPPKNRKHTDAFVSGSDLEVQGDLQ